MNTEINYTENNKQSTKELCASFDKEDGLPLGTHYRKYVLHITISCVTMTLLVSLGLYSLIK